MTQLAKDIRRVSSSDGGVVLDLHRGTMYRLNPLGSQILDLLDKGLSVARIADQVSAECGVSLDIVQADLKEFLESLELHGVIDPRGL